MERARTRALQNVARLFGVGVVSCCGLVIVGPCHRDTERIAGPPPLGHRRFRIAALRRTRFPLRRPKRAASTVRDRQDGDVLVMITQYGPKLYKNQPEQRVEISVCGIVPLNLEKWTAAARRVSAVGDGPVEELGGSGRVIREACWTSSGSARRSFGAGFARTSIAPREEDGMTTATDGAPDFALLAETESARPGSPLMRPVEVVAAASSWRSWECCWPTSSSATACRGPSCGSTRPPRPPFSGW